ncbi:MAG: PQQ-dependent dehydrogenase, methanol/ethanol family [Nevskiaceae bacterium]|jgi:quinohemoprotein ethanol dehydrogenase|nr:PQQ-dependent dehydrogenase, methanol/ethanol family [Nevskiaceae bacterium]
MRSFHLALAPLMLCALAACQQTKPVDAARLTAADAQPGQWMMDGRNYDAQRFSPLKQIDESNVAQLGLAWYADMDTYRGVEATPLFVDGVIYNTSAFNITTAYDARTGRLLWTYDPQVPRENGRYACCEPVARGLAFWNRHVIIATLDGRIISLDAKTGTPTWTAHTFDNNEWPWTITGAPRVFDGVVVVGNGGADFGVRGFVSGWDADTGAMLWKFFLVPGDPSKGPDGAASDSVMEMAAKTWTGNWWHLGGGGTAWDSIAYDPALGLVFIGTGNGSPDARAYRSPEGDNLFLCSIVAVDVKTGQYRWHYQETPSEDWDYTCTQSIVQAELSIDGRQRKVLLHAPKNGFFYVIDRATGELISANNYVPVNWASSIDIATGKPNVNPEAHYGIDPVLVTPGPGGGHNWFPMAYSPDTQLAYFPAYEHWFVYALDPDFVPKPFRSNGGWGGYTGEALKKRMELQKVADEREKAWLMAWDPVKQQERWRVPLPRHGNGGVLATAGNLVFEGTTKQTFAAFRATDGEVLWEMPVQSAPVAGPISYELDGEQYIAVNAGWGGGAAQIERGAGTAMNRAAARLLVFKLGGAATLPELAPAPPIPNPPPLRASEETVQRGAVVFANTCAQCHGVLAVGGVKDLRQMSPEAHAQFNDIVLKGTRQEKGMASFASLINEEDAEAVHAYVIARANEDWGRMDLAVDEGQATGVQN